VRIDKSISRDELSAAEKLAGAAGTAPTPERWQVAGGPGRGFADPVGPGSRVLSCGLFGINPWAACVSSRIRAQTFRKFAESPNGNAAACQEQTAKALNVSPRGILGGKTQICALPNGWASPRLRVR
jgi:hypothetical protein